jgi:hypothetical protein
MAGPISPLEQRIIDIARKLGALPDLCRYVDYDPDVGRVPAHWRARWATLEMARHLRDDLEQGSALWLTE